MANNQAKRQQKLARKAKKDKQRRHVRSKRQAPVITDPLRNTSNAPILHCYMNLSIWEEGLGQVLVSRTMPSGEIAFGIFLVDAYCLGVKDAFANILTEAEYEGLIERSFGDDLRSITSADARKLVEEVVDYAGKLGFRPCEDYQLTYAIFGDIDASESDTEFGFGREGVPFFVNGPYESTADCQRIIATLERTVGEDNFETSIVEP